MAKKRKKYNIKKESTRQKRFLRDLKIPEGQVRQRLLKQEDKELVLDQYSPIVNQDSDERVIDTESKFNKHNYKKRFEDTPFGDAIIRQRKSRRGFLWKRRHSIRERVDVVECHIYDPDGNLLKSTFAQRGLHWNYVNENENTYETDDDSGLPAGVTIDDTVPTHAGSGEVTLQVYNSGIDEVANISGSIRVKSDVIPKSSTFSNGLSAPFQVSIKDNVENSTKGGGIYSQGNAKWPRITLTTAYVGGAESAWGTNAASGSMRIDTVNDVWSDIKIKVS